MFSFLGFLVNDRNTIGFIIPNTNQKSMTICKRHNYRPSHADYVYEKKYGVRDYRGGGRSSARETASRVVAGAIAKQMLPEIKINAYVSAVGYFHWKSEELDFSKPKP
jgi:chorismate synthase